MHRFASIPGRSVEMTTRALIVLSLSALTITVDAADRPNVLWIVVEDASPHIGCYGETAIKTPNLDALGAVLRVWPSSSPI